MKIEEMINQENHNKDKIYLHREGIFWRAYNYSAIRLCKYLKDYRVNVKYIKKVRDKIYYCGFPDGSLPQILDDARKKGYRIEVIDEKHLIINGFPVEELDYIEWKNAYTNVNALVVNEPEIVYNKDKVESILIRKIREFPLENSTPMQTMLFVQELKQIISNGHCI